ncbi:VOC family protein [Aromatoleum aromaticum]|uniref:VOC family protein n=1 Tax=Aromatoleum aromaticum TaxID=551760 RepID=UPI0014593269|nr:VOC family protein [Aromatoleum aromaticum]NMG55523.1 2,3-dihydroxy-p-cumate-3,4-dioxygenase [Aromatoleum aromaticum]
MEPAALPFSYDRLGYAALEVSDLSRSVEFYTELMGLDLVESDRECAFLRCGRDHHNLVLYQGSTPGLKRAAYQLASPDELDRAFQFIDANGLEPVWVPEGELRALKQGPTFRAREPNTGLVFEFFHHMTHLASPYAPRLTKIERIGHVVVGTSRYPQAVESLTKNFNFALSDFVEEKFSWMRCRPNPLHHTFAVGASTRNHLHHINFMATDIDDIGMAAARMQKAGVQIVFGPGRHLPSTSIFLYFLDPDGMTMEFSFGMEEIHESNARMPRMLEMHPRTMDIWGGPMPHEMFGKTGMIEGAHV